MGAALALPGPVHGQDLPAWQLGGSGGQSWSEVARAEILIEHAPEGGIQPMAFDPQQNLLPRLGPWFDRQVPTDPSFIMGHPRIWRGNRDTRQQHEKPPTVYVDGDPTTFNWNANFLVGRWQEEFYTIDVGGPIPAERFVFSPPPGTDQFGELWENYAPRNFELTASVTGGDIPREGGTQYEPLSVQLAAREQHLEVPVEVPFPLQYLRYFRIKAFPQTQERGQAQKLAWAEMELYARGVAARAQYRSQPVDLGRAVTFGRVLFSQSRWRRDGERQVAAPEAPTAVEVRLKSGLDDTPTDFFTYNDQGELRRVPRETYQSLRPRQTVFDPEFVGWQGPVAEDRENWTPWTVPLRESGVRPGLASGRYLQVSLELRSDAQWAFARVDSLAVEVFPLLSGRLVGELVAVDAQIRGGLVEAPIGRPVSVVWVLRAGDAEPGQAGFDAVRIEAPPSTRLEWLEMGEPASRAEPDSLVQDEGSLTVYLPRPVDGDGVVKVGLTTTLYNLATTLQGEVFRRRQVERRQSVSAGDAEPGEGTNQLSIVAARDPERLLHDVEVRPGVLTPNGDGVGDDLSVEYTLAGVLAADMELSVHTLGGRRVYHTLFEGMAAGRHRALWGGVDGTGRRVVPGLYLCRLAARTDGGEVVTVVPVAVAW